MSIYSSIFQSPIGGLQIKATDSHISSVLFLNTLKNPHSQIDEQQAEEIDMPLIAICKTQLGEYFEGNRTTFDLPLFQQGTPFQQQVWQTLSGITYGKTISYLELSKRINNVKAIRAVGTTNGKNLINIIIPCHRVIGSTGNLTGYSGDLWRKKWLLDHEAKFANGVQLLF